MTQAPIRQGRWLRLVGKVSVALGVLFLLFVGYQLWGTGLRMAQAQSELDQEFRDLRDRQERLVAEASTTTLGPTGPNDPQPTPTTTTAPAPPPLPPPVEGDPVGLIDIPAIGIEDLSVVEGTTVDQLARGPGHFPTTPLPGQSGNAAIAGHRTTHGAPFFDIDQLEPGDLIVVETLQGESRYEVVEQRVVAPSEVGVVGDQGDDRLTLTTCEPKYSAAQRLVTVARLVTAPLVAWPAAPAPMPAPTATTAPEAGPGPDGPVLPGEPTAEPPPSDADPGRGAPSPGPGRLDGGGGDALHAVAWALVCAAVVDAGWAATRLARRSPWPPARVLPSVVGLPVFLVALFFCFESVSRLLPASY